jgi:diketogulonate reductase-like aldo/keto reductase
MGRTLISFLQAIYGNEESVGAALVESGLARTDFYLTTKYDGGDIQKAVRDSLDKASPRRSLVSRSLLTVSFVAQSEGT